MKKIKTKIKQIFKKNNKFYMILLLIFLSIFIYCGYEIVRWLIDDYNTNQVLEEIYENTQINEVIDGENSEIIEPDEEIESSNVYWDFISANYIDVDILELQQTNSDTVAWLKLEGTNINYPVVQSDDNEYYLTHSFDKTYNTAGWIFADYRNSADLTDKNMIMYGHGRLNSVMFGTLKNILTSGWLDDTSNYLVRMSFADINTVWQVFSVYVTDYTTDYLQVNFSSDDDFYDFANMLLDRSNHDFGTTVNEDDKIITLSTCYGDDGQRVVLHAKLIKSEIKD